MSNFIHLHNHTQYSLLDGASSISRMMDKTLADGMQAVAITDHGNMFGVFDFVAQAKKRNLKPIIGCEFYVVENRHQKQFTQQVKDKRYHQLFLAKDEEGYKNLSKLCSLGYIEGLYSKYPRIDKELVLQYHKGLIATSCCIGAEIPQSILNEGEAEAEKKLKWWLDLFGEDYYIELQRHDLPEQALINATLMKFAVKYGIKMIATNDSHYVDEDDASAHDILLCINTGENRSRPIGDNKGERFGFPNNQFYFKKQDEMKALFKDVPEAIENTLEVGDKIKSLSLTKDILLPNFPIDQAFEIHTSPEYVLDPSGKTVELAPNVLNQWEYLKHLTFTGAFRRYKELTPEIEERLNFELFTIKTMGFAGYFLIVADFIQTGRDMGVFVGPGRGSAAGSAVAYCIGITNIDPIKYDLLFERFLNPERKSMPDIDTDFDDEGRKKVIDYVVQKYGRNQVAQIVTLGTMAAKSSIKDVARALELKLEDSNMLSKLVPDKPGISLNRILHAPLDGGDGLKGKEGLGSDEIEMVQKLRKFYEGDGLHAEVLREAVKLEGSIRNTGIHAAGIIIAPEELTEIIPVAVSKDSDLLVTQFEGSIIENAGVIKMDFLGLKNLSIIKLALQKIKKRYGIDIDPDQIPLDDPKALDLYKRAETKGTFQFESAGMQKYLKDLKPDRFEDLIAMNALFRPGPLEYIPSFIRRKHGKEAISYDLPEMEEYLKETYGITVYQEQVMLLSQKLAGFTKGEADILRKAMGKKDRATLDKLKPKFIEQASEKGHPAKVLEKIWTDWEAFASYAFNKSHSTCYAFVAFQTAYLKANYPAEYMAALLTYNRDSVDKVAYYIEECHNIGIKVLPACINESDLDFDATSETVIRFGLGAIRGVGNSVAEAIIQEREKNGPYEDVFDLCARVQGKQLSRRVLEAIVKAGAFDSFGKYRREEYLEPYPNASDGSTFLDKALSFGLKISQEKNSSQVSLFGGPGGDASFTHVKPTPPKIDFWTDRRRLEAEKEVLGLYLSGHPLDRYMPILRAMSIHSIQLMKDTTKVGTTRVAGILIAAQEGVTKNDKKRLVLTFEDTMGEHTLTMYGDAALKFSNFKNAIGSVVVITGSIQQRFRDREDKEFVPVDMVLLDTIADDPNRRLLLYLSLKDFDHSTHRELLEILQTHSGENACFIKVIFGLDPFLNEIISDIALDMQNIKVKIAPELLKELENANFRFELK